MMNMLIKTYETRGDRVPGIVKAYLAQGPFIPSLRLVVPVKMNTRVQEFWFYGTQLDIKATCSERKAGIKVCSE